MVWHYVPMLCDTFTMMGLYVPMLCDTFTMMGRYVLMLCDTFTMVGLYVPLLCMLTAYPSLPAEPLPQCPPMEGELAITPVKLCARDSDCPQNGRCCVNTGLGQVCLPAAEILGIHIG